MHRFIETIRIENERIHHLETHQQRFDRTRAAFFPNGKPIDLKQCLSAEGYTERTRCRVEYDSQIRSVSYLPYTIRPVKRLRCVEANAPDYAFKKADRSALNALFELRGTADDVLIVCKNCLTDTSICNIALWNGRQWLTPATPLLGGTMRERLLHEGIIRTATIRADELSHYQTIRLFNAMIDFGEIELPVSAIQQD